VRLLSCLSFLAACPAPPPQTTPRQDASSPLVAATPPRVVVIGGGIAGLAAAYQLEKEGLPIHLLEASDILGGRVQTAYYGEGLDAEYGMQEMWRGNPLLDIAKELRVELDGEPEPPYSSVLLDGKVVPYIQPTTKAYFDTFLDAKEQKALADWMEMGKALREEALKDGLASTKVREIQGISFSVWLTTLKLPKKVADWIRLTLECELAASADQFSALAGLIEFEIFFGGDVENYHVKGGNTKLIRAMGDAIAGPKTMGALVTGVRRTTEASGKQKVEVVYVKDNIVRTLEAERAVLAVPFFRIHQIHFEPPLSEERTQGIQSLGLGQYTVVHFLTSREARSLWTVDGESVLPVLTDGTLGVIYGVQHDPPDSQPLDVFALLVYGMRARLFHMVPRDLKVQEAIGELDRMWPGFAKHVKATHVYTYHPASLAVFPPGRSPIDDLAKAVRTPDRGVYFAGDWTLGSHSDHAARSGIDAAKAIAAELAGAATR
jgi:monoamine oxidase